MTPETDTDELKRNTPVSETTPSAKCGECGRIEGRHFAGCSRYGLPSFEELGRVNETNRDNPADASATCAQAEPVDPESEAANPVWDLVIQACAQAWGPGKLVWSQSPTELIVDIINERDEAMQDALRYRFLRVRGCALDGTDAQRDGLVHRCINLDEEIDALTQSDSTGVPK